MVNPQNRHVAVLAFPFGTHAAPLLTLVRRLAAAAPAVRFSFFSTPKSNASLIFSGFDNLRPYSVSDGSPEDYVFSGNFPEVVRFFVGATPANFEKAMEVAEEETGLKVNCLLTDAFLWFAEEIAAAMGVPWVPFWTAGAASLSVHMYTDLIRTNLQETTTTDEESAENADKTIEFVPGMSAIKISDLQEGVVSENVHSPVAPLVHNMGLKVPKATAVVLNSFEELNPAITNDLKTKLKMLLNIGPLHLSSPPTTSSSNSDDSGCISWLDKNSKSSVVYISFGTVAMLPPDELSTMAEALEASDVPFLWSLREDKQRLLPEGFLERASNRGKVVSWAPQLQVLSHAAVGAFMTHCGWNSILESIGGGVPMICRPFFGDQNLNCRVVEDVWKVGVKVGDGVFTRNAAMNAIDLVLRTEKGKNMRDNIGVLRENAVNAVGTNGSSTENFKFLLEIVTGENRELDDWVTKCDMHLLSPFAQRRGL